MSPSDNLPSKSFADFGEFELKEHLSTVLRQVFIREVNSSESVIDRHCILKVMCGK